MGRTATTSPACRSIQRASSPSAERLPKQRGGRTRRPCRRRKSIRAGLRYELTHLAMNTPAVNGDNPPGGLIAAASLTYVYSDARRFVRSISSEQGQRFSLAARVSAKALGSDFTFGQLSASYARFFA